MTAIDSINTCESCCMEFVPRYRSERRGEQRFCSRACWENRPKKSRVERFCTGCGVGMMLYPSVAKTRRFCSRSCMARWRIASGEFMPHQAKPLRECAKCGASFPANSGRQRWCKMCVPNRSARARIRRYGISAPEFAAMFEAQGWACALCLRPGAKCVDHDHVTGAVRGILCRPCNRRLETLENDVWLLRATAYLKGGGPHSAT